jgi:hypothetical protein
MAGFNGFLQADGYSGFDALYDAGRANSGILANTSITEVACWAHCRRKFFDVWQATKSPVAKEALDPARHRWADECQGSGRDTKDLRIGKFRNRAIGLTVLLGA